MTLSVLPSGIYYCRDSCGPPYGDDDVDTPCWIQLDVLPALEQGQGNVTQGKGLFIMSRKKKVSCSVTQVVEFVTLLVPLSLSAFFAEEISGGLVSSSETSFVQRKSQ